jgi:hypothetical protein
MTGDRSAGKPDGRHCLFARIANRAIHTALLAAFLLLSPILRSADGCAQSAGKNAGSRANVSDTRSLAKKQPDCASTPFSRPQIAIGANWSLGLSGRTASLLYAPAQVGMFNWAIGPAVVLPAVISANGEKPWGAGASAVASRSEGPWSYGALITNVWSFGATNTSTDGLNALSLQPFISYDAGEGWYATSAPAIVANWSAEGAKWSLPLSGSIGKRFALGDMPMDLQLQGALEPDLGGDGADWQLKGRLTVPF